MVSLSDDGSANCEDVQRIPYTNILGLNEVSHLRVVINFGFLLCLLSFVFVA